MQITRAGATSSARGLAEYFTGTVRIDAPFPGEAPARIGDAPVTFEPGARTNGHTHPLGRTLIVLSGLGRCQRAGGTIEAIRPGDSVCFAPGEKHGHGAGAETAMSHIAIAEALGGVAVTWLEPVTDPA